MHQGALLITAPLPEVSLETVTSTGKPLIVLDQVTDPRNIGAIIRAATVFGAGGLVMTRHNSPASGGALAKTASGALEKMPLVRVANLTRCLLQRLMLRQPPQSHFMKLSDRKYLMFS